MMKSFWFFIFFSVLLIGKPVSVIASDSFSIHTHTSALELKPASILGSYKTAAVCFIGFGDCDPNVDFGKGDDYSIDTENQCKNEGFTLQNCSAVQELTGVCPYNAVYGKGCKCRTDLVSCPSGQVGAGDSCGGQYASCQCISGVPTGSYGCKTYYASPCGHVCQEEHGDNCHIRSAVSTPYGCMSNFADCASKCERAYPDNCRNRTDVYAPSECQQAWSDCASKCEYALLTDSVCQIGYIYYSDNTCSLDTVSGKTPIAIVIDANKKLAISLSFFKDYWSKEQVNISNLTNTTTENLAFNDLDGKTNTKKIKQFFEEKGKSSIYPVPYGAVVYSTAGTNSGEWFLPSAGQFNIIYKNKNTINKALNKIGKNILPNDWYWTSSEQSTLNTWSFNLGSGSIYAGSKLGNGSYNLLLIDYSDKIN